MLDHLSPVYMITRVIADCVVLWIEADEGLLCVMDTSAQSLACMMLLAACGSSSFLHRAGCSCLLLLLLPPELLSTTPCNFTILPPLSSLLPPLCTSEVAAERGHMHACIPTTARRAIRIAHSNLGGFPSRYPMPVYSIARPRMLAFQQGLGSLGAWGKYVPALIYFILFFIILNLLLVSHMRLTSARLVSYARAPPS